MDATVLAAWITAGAALVVAIGGAVRASAQTGEQRRYERRRTFLIEAQDAMLALRDALAAYGAALHEQLRGPSTVHAGVRVRGHPSSTPAASFVMAVPDAVGLRVESARGRLLVARSRLEDVRVDAAIGEWAVLAQASKIDPHDTQTSAEEAAFVQVNELIRSALRTNSGNVDDGPRRWFGWRAARHRR